MGTRGLGGGTRPSMSRLMCLKVTRRESRASSSVLMASGLRVLVRNVSCDCANVAADKSIKIWKATDGHYVTTLDGHMYGVNDISWSPYGDIIASASDDKTVRLWHSLSGKSLKILKGHTNYVYCVAFSPLGNILASGSYDESVQIWDVRSGSVMRQLPAHSDPVTAVDFSPDGTLIVSCGQDGLM